LNGIEKTYKTGQKTRKILTIHRLQHPRVDIDHLHIQRKETRRGLLQIEGFYVAEITILCNIWKVQKILWYILSGHTYMAQDQNYCKHVKLQSFQNETKEMRNITPHSIK